MRIVGGRLRGRTLVGPKPGIGSIRPTSDRLRESLFNVLAHAYDDAVEGARVLDLFAGTGAMAFEALSRGAAFALLVDDGTEARGLIRENQMALGLAGLAASFGATRPSSARSARWPPFGAGLLRSALSQGAGREGAGLGPRRRLAGAGRARRAGGGGRLRGRAAGGFRGARTARVWRDAGA